MFLVEQGGTVDGQNLGVTSYLREFDTLTFNSSFNNATFSRLIGSGSVIPDFSGSIVTRFGSAGGNSGSGTLTQYYDNFGELGI